jgi:FtsH-binding integral membrane protein
MAAGLILTAVAAQITASSPSILRLVFGSRAVTIGLILAELGLVLFLSGCIERIALSTAMGVFVLYSLLNGVTLSIVLLVYTGDSVASAFLTTAGMFGVMSVYGLYTKRDLSGLGSLLIMGLWGLIIAMAVNMFIGSGAMDLTISVIGILIFLGLTAWDTQYLRNLGEQMDVDGDERGRKLVLIGALRLYLDFVNIFLYLLRLFGKRR